jgi:hypothetical protein
MAGQCSRIDNLAVVLLGTVGSFATPPATIRAGTLPDRPEAP